MKQESKESKRNFRWWMRYPAQQDWVFYQRAGYYLWLKWPGADLPRY